MTRALRLAPVALGALLLLLVWTVGRDANPGPIGFRLDDAWIHMVYGRGLLANGYLAYEDGTPSTGCTSPAWAACLAVAHALFDRAGTGGAPDGLIAAVIALGALLHLGAVAAAGSVARALSLSEAAGVVAGGLVALATPLAAASVSGMEVALTSLLLLLGLRAVVARKNRVAGLWLAAAGLARPECGASILLLAAAACLLAPRARRRRELMALLAAPAVAALLLVGYDVWASGAPLPATFYAKSSASLVALPHRLGVALGVMLATVPALGFGVGWIAAAGLLAGARRRPPSSRERSSAEPVGERLAPWLPFATGAAFLLANLAVLDPHDPAAFYHLRYVLPPVPLFLVAAALGANALGQRWPRARTPALAVLAGAALLQSGTSVVPESRHLHNDVRNINEVQRRIGEELRASLPPGTRIAASDAGAVRYFSRLPTLDVIGMNTPGMRAPTDAFLASHPVAAFAFLPAWFKTPDAAQLVATFQASTQRYSVTSDPAMATQIVVQARPDAGGGPVRARFVGFRAFALDFVPPGTGSLSGRASP